MYSDYRVRIYSVKQFIGTLNNLAYTYYIVLLNVASKKASMFYDLDI